MKTERSGSIVIYKGRFGEVRLNADYRNDTIWATQEQIAGIFGVNRPAVTKHINNIYKSGELDEQAVCSILELTAADGKNYKTKFYSLDMMLSVGYRVNSAQATEFRRWANSVLRDFLMQGYALNRKRLSELHTVIDILGRSDAQEIASIADVLRDYTDGLNTLDDYDHQRVAKTKIKAKAKAWQLSYKESRQFIDSMRFGRESALFGNEKDESFKASLGAIYQTFDGQDVYPSVQEKAANLLYLVVKNHSFSDGNKRIAAALFVYFLEKNRALRDKAGRLIIANNALAAITLMLALSKSQEKELMCALVMKMLEVKA